MARRKKRQADSQPVRAAVEAGVAAAAETVPTPLALGGSFSAQGLGWLTLERALYALFLLAAAGTRLGDLGRWPLSEAEAGTALDAWHFLQGAGGSVLGHSPLVFHGDLIAFALFGSGDAQARLMTALAGVALVGLPYSLRPVLGRFGALMTGLFLLTSPTFLYFSRRGTSEVVAAACALAFLGGVVQLRERGGWGALILATIALGLGLASGPAFYTHLFLWGLFVAAVLAIRRRSENGSRFRPDRDMVRQAVLVVAATFGLASTAFLADWSGLQAAVALPGAWLWRIVPAPSGYPWSFYVSRLALYEPLALVLAAAGAVYLIRRRDLWMALGLFWFVGALVLYSTLGRVRPTADMVAIALPLILLAGMTAGRLLDDVVDHAAWEIEGAYLLLMSPVAAFAVLNLQAYANTGIDRHMLLAVSGVAVMLVLFSLVGFWGGAGALVRSGGCALIVLLTAGQIRGAWNLSLERADNPAEPMVAVATSPDVRRIPETIATFSNERLRRRDAVSVGYQADLGPVIAWYLREFKDVRAISGAGEPGLPAVVLLPFSEESPPLGEEYIGQRFRLWRRWHRAELRGSQRMRWLLYRDVTSGYTNGDVILYVRALD
jgi:uncharacterized protein (TIGR03663 family)